MSRPVHVQPFETYRAHALHRSTRNICSGRPFLTCVCSGALKLEAIWHRRLVEERFAALRQAWQRGAQSVYRLWGQCGAVVLAFAGFRLGLCLVRIASYMLVSLSYGKAGVESATWCILSVRITAWAMRTERCTFPSNGIAVRRPPLAYDGLGSRS